MVVKVANVVNDNNKEPIPLPSFFMWVIVLRVVIDNVENTSVQKNWVRFPVTLRVY